MKVAADTGNRRLMEDVTRDFPARAFLMYQRIETPEPESAPKERVRMEVLLDRAQKSAVSDRGLCPWSVVGFSRRGQGVGFDSPGSSGG